MSTPTGFAVVIDNCKLQAWRALLRHRNDVIAARVPATAFTEKLVPPVSRWNAPRRPLCRPIHQEQGVGVGIAHCHGGVIDDDGREVRKRASDAKIE